MKNIEDVQRFESEGYEMVVYELDLFGNKRSPEEILYKYGVCGVLNGETITGGSIGHKIKMLVTDVGDLYSVNGDLGWCGVVLWESDGEFSGSYQPAYFVEYCGKYDDSIISEVSVSREAIKSIYGLAKIKLEFTEHKTSFQEDHDYDFAEVPSPPELTLIN